MSVGSKIIIVIFLTSYQFILSNKESASSTQNTNIITIYASEFDDHIMKFEYLLINFYSDSCSFSKNFEPEYIRLAETLQKNKFNIKLAKVNISGNHSLISKYDLRGTPTLILLKNGNFVSTFYGEKKVRELQTWVFKMINEKVLKINNEEEIYNLWNKFSISSFLFGNNEKCPKIFEEFNNLAFQFDDIVLAYCDSNSCSKSFNAENCDVFLFKHVDTKKEIYKESLESISLSQWMELNKLPLILDFDQYSSSLVFSSMNPAVFLFRDKEILAEQTDKFDNYMKEVALKYKVNFVLN